MSTENEDTAKQRSRKLSRREFVRLAATAGLLAGCRPARQVLVTATPSPAPTSSPAPTPAPGTLSRVVRARHPDVWNGDELRPDLVRRMLDASITRFTGLDDAPAAWASLFDPGERIAIKVSTIRTSDFWTHVPLVNAVTQSLQDAGVPAGQIVVFDRFDSELERAGFTINRDGPGVRCYGTDNDYTPGWTLLGDNVRLSNILLGCDALINMPILKVHNHSGVTFAMKNYFGIFDRPGSFHRPRTGEAIVELNSLPPVRERMRLIVGDALVVSPICQGSWIQGVTGDSFLISSDPVAHDVVGLQILVDVMTAEGYDTTVTRELADTWLPGSAEAGLGTNQRETIDLMEVVLE